MFAHRFRLVAVGLIALSSSLSPAHAGGVYEEILEPAVQQTDKGCSAGPQGTPCKTTKLQHDQGGEDGGGSGGEGGSDGEGDGGGEGDGVGEGEDGGSGGSPSGGGGSSGGGCTGDECGG